MLASAVAFANRGAMGAAHVYCASEWMQCVDMGELPRHDLVEHEREADASNSKRKPTTKRVISQQHVELLESQLALLVPAVHELHCRLSLADETYDVQSQNPEGRRSIHDIVTSLKLPDERSRCLDSVENPMPANTQPRSTHNASNYPESPEDTEDESSFPGTALWDDFSETMTDSQPRTPTQVWHTPPMPAQYLGPSPVRTCVSVQTPPWSMGTPRHAAQAAEVSYPNNDQWHAIGTTDSSVALPFYGTRNGRLEMGGAVIDDWLSSADPWLDAWSAQSRFC